MQSQIPYLHALYMYQVKNDCVVEPAKENPKVREREEKRKQFFLQQEKKLRAKQVKLRCVECSHVELV